MHNFIKYIFFIEAHSLGSFQKKGYMNNTFLKSVCMPENAVILCIHSTVWLGIKIYVEGATLLSSRFL